MKAPPFSYHAPESIEEALDLLQRLENPKIIAGGQSLMPMLNFRVVLPDHLIDIGNIAELKGIQWSADGVSIGATTTQRTIQRSEVVARECPLLLQALDYVGHQTTRNRGTIGGSLCHLDPAAELPLACRVLEPIVHCAGPQGIRQVPFAEFPVEHLTTSLEPDEILIRIDFPHAVPGSCSAFEEFARRPADFAIASVAVLLVLDEESVARDVRIGAGGIAPVPVRLSAAEQVLSGQRLDASSIAAAAEAAGTFPAEGDHNNPAEYRQALVRTLTRRALHRALDNQHGAAHG